MNDRLKEAFSQVKAGEDLKEKTRTFLGERTRGNGRRKRIGYQPYISAAVCLLSFMIGGHWRYFTPTARISIDVNPSIELEINRFDKVVSVDAYNDDGRELADSLEIRFMGYKEAVNQILENETVTALLSDNEVLTITVIESKGEQSVRILSNIESSVARHQNTYCYSADLEEVAPAHGHGLSCGKYRAYLEVQKLYPEVTTEQIQGMTMGEIQELMNALSENVLSGEEPEMVPDSQSGERGHGHQQRRRRHGNGHHGNQ